MKKLISIILAAAMLLSMSSLAFAADYTLGYNGKVTVTASYENVAKIEFIAPKTGAYLFRTESDNVDTGAYFLDENDEYIESVNYEDDVDGNMNFRAEIQLEEGDKCYLFVYTYDSEIVTFDVVSECGHDFADSVCIYCEKVCDHTEIAELGFCLCGEVFLGTDLEADTEYLHENFGGAPAWFRFVPERSGIYSFRSVSEDGDPDCVIYNSCGEEVDRSTDDIGMDFRYLGCFNKGETCYFKVYNCYSEPSEMNFAFERIAHFGADGNEHELEIVEETYSTCVEHGYSKGVYCASCDLFVEGHEEYALDRFAHTDMDDDEICDDCGADTVFYCTCICHYEEGFFAFIWRIANFIHSLLGISEECECGEWHW